MSEHSPVRYTYDGTYEGFLTCVFESFDKREIPQDILPPDQCQLSLIPTREIVTDLQKAHRVRGSIPKKIGPQAASFLESCFLTCLIGKEVLMLDFLRKGYRQGEKILDHLTDDTIYTLQKAVRHLGNESHQLKGFIRFSIYHNILVSVIHPKNLVLPLLRPHFCDRYCNESFLIYDCAHGMGLCYRPYEWRILPMHNLVLEQPDEEEQTYRRLWKEYYDTIAIKERENPICRMSHMPKRYWDYMTEFGAKEQRRREYSSEMVDRLARPNSAGRLDFGEGRPNDLSQK